MLKVLLGRENVNRRSHAIWAEQRSRMSVRMGMGKRRKYYSSGNRLVLTSQMIGRIDLSYAAGGICGGGESTTETQRN